MRGSRKNGSRSRQARVERQIELSTRALVGKGFGTEGSRVEGRGREESERCESELAWRVSR